MRPLVAMRGQSVPSKLYSCSELVEGHQAMVAVKREGDSPRTLAQKIKETSTIGIVENHSRLKVAVIWNKHEMIQN